MVSVTASEPGGREFYRGLCFVLCFCYNLQYVCTASLLQVRFMVTSELSLTCCKLTASLHSCHANLSQTCTLAMPNLWQACCKLKLLSGIGELGLTPGNLLPRK
ncbi:hypothetical protein AVEN_150895-1 [Araneus ventricosus]|uniref:Uncharacterized protein n=1 Tax=Araneus ventricosus TaxID=182803 RepID=A0A4Y2CBP0_ARAVE|nr:hypothetical protein AVEN_150895-1 [Araneus ventricosus]